MLDSASDKEKEEEMATKAKRKPQPAPEKEPTAEELAQAMLKLPADHKWEYDKGKAPAE